MRNETGKNVGLCRPDGKIMQTFLRHKVAYSVIDRIHRQNKEVETLDLTCTTTISQPVAREKPRIHECALIPLFN